MNRHQRRAISASAGNSAEQIAHLEAQNKELRKLLSKAEQSLDHIQRGIAAQTVMIAAGVRVDESVLHPVMHLPTFEANIKLLREKVDVFQTALRLLGIDDAPPDLQVCLARLQAAERYLLGDPVGMDMLVRIAKVERK